MFSKKYTAWTLQFAVKKHIIENIKTLHYSDSIAII